MNLMNKVFKNQQGSDNKSLRTGNMKIIWGSGMTAWWHQGRKMQGVQGNWRGAVRLDHDEQGVGHSGGDWRGGWGQSLQGLEDHG